MGSYAKIATFQSAPQNLPTAKSLLFRGLIEAGKEREAVSLASGGGFLDSALLLYGEAFRCRNFKENNAVWSDILGKAEFIAGMSSQDAHHGSPSSHGDGGSDRDEAALILAIINSWAGKLDTAFHLAGQASTFEAYSFEL